MLKIVEKSKIWFTISLLIIITGLVFMGIKGLDYDIDFKGGTIIQIDMGKKFTKADVDKIVHKYAPEALTNTSGTKATEYDIKCKELSQDKINKMYKEIKDKYSLKAKTPTSQDTIGASFGNETKRNAAIAVLIATIAMLIYVGFRFEFKFGIAAILALLHDVLVTLAIYAIFQIPVGSGFVAAMLTVIGYSINDTIVVFDRIRENQKYVKRTDIVTLADASVTQTMARSINTVLTVLISLVCVHILVPSIRDFTKPLLVGIVSGCYSSIFIATPLWVIFKKHGKNYKKSIAAGEGEKSKEIKLEANNEKDSNEDVSFSVNKNTQGTKNNKAQNFKRVSYKKKKKQPDNN